MHGEVHIGKMYAPTSLWRLTHRVALVGLLLVIPVTASAQALVLRNIEEVRAGIGALRGSLGASIRTQTPSEAAAWVLDQGGLWSDPNFVELMTQVRGRTIDLSHEDVGNLGPILAELQQLPSSAMPITLAATSGASPQVSSAAERLCGATQFCTFQCLGGSLSEAMAVVGAPIPARADHIDSVWGAEADKIRDAYRTPNGWTEGLRSASDAASVEYVYGLTRRLWPHDAAKADEYFVRFYRSVLKSYGSMPEKIRTRNAELPGDWHKEPWYYTYVQYFGTQNGKKIATFDDLRARIPYLKKLGIKNVFILPHYDSPMGDVGYDVASFTPREDLGGKSAYEAAMEALADAGIRVASDFPFNHTSVTHPWFRNLRAGDPNFLDHYIQVNGWQQIWTDGSWARYRTPEGLIVERSLIFRDVSTTHIQVVDVDGATPSQLQYWRTFYPFQMDVNLKNPDVWEHMLDLLGAEAASGMVGQRLDAAEFWWKNWDAPAGPTDETFALHELTKAYLAHVAPGSITMPEVVARMHELRDYFGQSVTIVGRRQPAGGDAAFAFRLQGAIRSAMFDGDVTPWWNVVNTIPDLPSGAVFTTLLGHHDEVFNGFLSDKERLVRYMEERGGVTFKNGISTGGRYADFLDNDPRRIAAAYFMLFTTPGTPMIYYGDEIGARHNQDFYRSMAEERAQILNDLNMNVTVEGSLDPRDLNRGPIKAEDFDRAFEEAYLPTRTVARLTRLHSSLPSIREMAARPIAIDTGSAHVYSHVRKLDGEKAAWSLANTTAEPITIEVSYEQLRAALGDSGEITLQDVIAERPTNFSYEWIGDRAPQWAPEYTAAGTIRITLQPFEFHLLQPR